MRTYPKALTAAVIGTAVIAGLVLFAPHVRDLTAHARQNAAVAPAVAKDTPAPHYAPIAPADVLGTGTPWQPLTGDGSN